MTGAFSSAVGRLESMKIVLHALLVNFVFRCFFLMTDMKSLQQLQGTKFAALCL